MRTYTYLSSLQSPPIRSVTSLVIKRPVRFTRSVRTGSVIFAFEMLVLLLLLLLALLLLLVVVVVSA